MKFYWLAFGLLFTVLVSCKKSEDKSMEPVSKDVTEDIISNELSPQDINNLKLVAFALDPKTKQQIVDWQAYSKLEELIDNIKQADLNYFLNTDDDMQTMIKDLKGAMPKSIQSDATLARILAVETQLLKLKSLSNLSTTKKPELLDSIKDLLEAFYNLNFQMNSKVEADNINIEKP
ncbi:hypothetical protein V8G61_09625 [Gaetbulibacter sp. M240]|uniref:hypothetical protein n=1 Tax=Gaetbulibacter sp. M240 TaxID=3126511 RepID=UPI00374F3731